MFDFVMKQMLKAKLKDIPESEQERIMAVIDKNPDFFKNLASELSKEIDSGKEQMEAVAIVIKRHEDELKKLVK